MNGHQFLTDEVQVQVPKVTWQIDSFGNSKGFARLASDMGFKGMFYGRDDYEERN